MCEITERLVKDWERLCLIMLQDNFKHASIQLCFKITSISRSFRVLTKALFIYSYVCIPFIFITCGQVVMGETEELGGMVHFIVINMQTGVHVMFACI